MFYVYLLFSNDKNNGSYAKNNGSYAISYCFDCFYNCLIFIEKNYNHDLKQVNIYKKGDNNNENYIRAKNDL